MTAIFKINRRTALRGIMNGAAVCVGLPFLDCYLNANGTALADGTPLPIRFGNWFWGCGLNPGRWEPAKAGLNYAVPVELGPLAAFQRRLNVYSGFQVFTDGKPAIGHFTGDMAVLTGNVPTGYRAAYPSIDTLISDRIGTKTRFRSLEVAATGKASDSLSGRSGNAVNPAETSPAALYARIFGPEFKGPNGVDFTSDPVLMARRSVLSALGEERQTLIKALGAADRVRLDEYFTALRELEQQLDIELNDETPLAACPDVGRPIEAAEETISTDIEKAVANHAVFAGLLAHALACNHTRVFNVVFADPCSSLRKAGMTATHHLLTHEEPVDEQLGYQPQVTWFFGRIMEGLGTMLSALDGIREGDGTLLDRTLVLATSETGYAKRHSLENIPMLTIGGAGGRMRTGVHVVAKGDPVTRVGLTVQQAMGVPAVRWGTGSLETSATITEVMA